MINRIKQSGNETTYLVEFTVDQETEIQDLPVYPHVAKGSLCLVIENCSVYILNGDNRWVLLEGGNSNNNVLNNKEIDRIEVSNDNHLIFYFTDGTTQDCGEININIEGHSLKWSAF